VHILRKTLQGANRRWSECGGHDHRVNARANIHAGRIRMNHEQGALLGVPFVGRQRAMRSPSCQGSGEGGITRRRHQSQGRKSPWTTFFHGMVHATNKLTATPPTGNDTRVGCVSLHTRAAATPLSRVFKISRSIRSRSISSRRQCSSSCSALAIFCQEMHHELARSIPASSAGAY
jgi:hypothetical protein